MDWMESACTDPSCSEKDTAHPLSACSSGLLTIVRYARLVVRREIKEEARIIEWMEHAEQCRDAKCIVARHEAFAQPVVSDIEWVREAAREAGRSKGIKMAM